MRLALALLALALFGCANEPVSESQTNNKSMTVAHLFDHEGCAVYRFYDDGHFHYYAVCSDKRTSMIQQQPAGKMTYPEEMTTVIR